VASSTGNHGVAVAAYAAAAGLESVVMFPDEVPRAAIQEAMSYGALVLRMPWAMRKDVLSVLLSDEEVWLSNRNDPHPWGNPYGVEGYKQIAYELVEDLAGQVPAVVVVPTCGADGLYGIWKGFAEMRAAGHTTRVPRMVAVQPAVGAPLVEAFVADRDRDDVPEIPLRYSRALSLTDSRSGRLGLDALRESDGLAFTLSEAAIAEAVADLAEQGVSVDPASACAVGVLGQVFGQLAGRDLEGPVVSIVTGRGARWPAEEPSGRFHATTSMDEAVGLAKGWLAEAVRS
jgi:threonine synthase